MEHLDILISEEEIKKRVKELAKEITKNYKGKDLCLICVLKGAIMFMVDLAKEIDLLLEMDLWQFQVMVMKKLVVVL